MINNNNTLTNGKVDKGKLLFIFLVKKMEKIFFINSNGKNIINSSNINNHLSLFLLLLLFICYFLEKRKKSIGG